MSINADTAPIPFMLDVADRRSEEHTEAHPLEFSTEKLVNAMTACGVDWTNAEFRLVIRFTEAEGKPNYGYVRRSGDAWIIKVRVFPKSEYESRHNRIINSVLLHELRHVAQLQLAFSEDPDYDMFTFAANQELLGSDAPEEVEARQYGRLVYNPNNRTVDTGIAGPPLGKQVWAVEVK